MISEEREEETTIRSSPDRAVKATRSVVTPSLGGGHVNESYEVETTVEHPA